MADKKADRYRPKRSLPPTQSGKSAPSGPGTIGTAEDEREEKRSALLDKFLRREELWRTRQALHDREVVQTSAAQSQTSVEATGSSGEKGSGEGGAK